MGVGTEVCIRLASVLTDRTSTSAAAERVFSMVESMFGVEQVYALADQIQSGVMLRYNKVKEQALVGLA